MTPILLHTKLLPPQPRPFLIHRPALLHQLTAGHQGKLTMVSAPAGFGKTTLVAHFVAHLAKPDSNRSDLTGFLPVQLETLQAKNLSGLLRE